MTAQPERDNVAALVFWMLATVVAVTAGIVIGIAAGAPAPDPYPVDVSTVVVITTPTGGTTP